MKNAFLAVIKNLLWAVFAMLILLSAILTLGGFLGDRIWYWDLANHFRMFYLKCQIPALILCIWLFPRFRSGKRIWLLTLLLAFGITLNLSAVLPDYFAHEPFTTNAPAGTTLRLLHANVFEDNTDYARLAAVIRKTDPDMVDLVEYTPRWQTNLEATGALNAYPYRVAGQGNMALYSRIPLKRTRFRYILPDQPSPNTANIEARFTLEDQPVTLIVAHPPIPVFPWNVRQDLATYRAWTAGRAAYGDNLILVGDLNTTPWSIPFHRFLAAAGLQDVGVGHGATPTWPVFFAPAHFRLNSKLLPMLIGIPIDHVLISPGLSAQSLNVGPVFGSDHLPLLTTLCLKDRFIPPAARKPGE